MRDIYEILAYIVAFTLPIVLLLLFVVNLYFSDVGMGGPREAGKDGHDSYKIFTEYNFVKPTKIIKHMYTAK